MSAEALTRVSFRAAAPATSHATLNRTVMLVLVLWAGAVLALGWLGVTTLLPTRLLPLPIALGTVLPLLVYARSAAFRAYISAVDLRTLTLFNVWRVPAALAFFYYGAQGELPTLFVRNAAWGDLIAGVLAPVVVFGFARLAAIRRASFVGFHLFSLADFVVAVGTGFAFSLLNDPLMGTLKALPIAIIPLFGVPVTGALSLMTLHRLLTRRA